MVPKNIEDPVPEKENSGKQFNPNYLFDYLISPIKTDYEFGKFIFFLNQELWSLKEIAIFETGICIFGKRFEIISQYVGD